MPFRARSILIVLIAMCILYGASGASIDQVRGSVLEELDFVSRAEDVAIRNDRIIVTLKSRENRFDSRTPPRSKRGACVSIDLGTIDCAVAPSDAFLRAKHCRKTDALILEPRPLIDSAFVSTALECLLDTLQEGVFVTNASNQKSRLGFLFKADPDQIEMDSEVHILAEDVFDQWHIEAIGAAGSDGFDAWDLTKGNRNVVVAVIDTGVDYKHPDLIDNAWINDGEIPGNGLDDDGNGLIDDVYGYDFANDDGDPMDDNGHGTHCAGIVGGVMNVTRRVSGVSPNVRVMAIKAMDAQGNGRLSDIITAVEYSLDMGAQITSNSFGSPDITHSVAFDRLLAVIEDAQQLYVAAAGNKGRDVEAAPEFPASLDSPMILSVAATTKDDRLADFSNFGSRSIDLGAPGVDILSTKRRSGYRTSKGTSMATPLVAATAALVLSTLHEANNSTAPQGLLVKQIILSSVDPIPALQGKTLTGGRLNAARAVAFANNTELPIENTPSNSASASPPAISVLLTTILTTVAWTVY